MKYKIGDKVRIQSKEWYESHKNKFGKVWTVCLSGEGTICFDQDNAEYCGKVLTIAAVEPENYAMVGNSYAWTDEMIEELAEEEVNFDVVVKETTKDISDKVVDTLMGGLMVGKSFNLPQGYIFKDENGNVINATKIVLEKKKKEYPKTYEECEKVLRYDSHRLDNMGVTVRGYKWELIRAFQMLLICRDAYWKIAGEEMGLGKPWEPDYKNPDIDLYVIINIYNQVEKAKYGYGFQHCTFTFPIEEMRDAFKENFDPDIEFCKEFL